MMKMKMEKIKPVGRFLPGREKLMKMRRKRRKKAER